jgi:hypothetical protein
MNIKNVRFPLLPLIMLVPFVAAGCASGPDASEPDPEDFAAQVDRRLDSDPNKKTCRTIRPTGSRLGERVCKTNYEWAQIEEESRSAIGRVQQDGNVATGGGE